MPSMNSSPCFFHHFFAIYKITIQAMNHRTPNKTNKAQVADNTHNIICHHPVQLLQIAIIRPTITHINTIIIIPCFSIVDNL